METECEYCRDTGWVYQILNYSDMTIDPGSEPIYEKVPCEDCYESEKTLDIN